MTKHQKIWEKETGEPKKLPVGEGRGLGNNGIHMGFETRETKTFRDVNIIFC